ncbi:hypothetical protein EBME_1080 [bacterium endosymbiont of Mortierella elongata FMR23-6]|nr:hypothetical protein EBME_1080 [bacterium endosymbiont of Mortierella elongata FMR23-6]
MSTACPAGLSRRSYEDNAQGLRLALEFMPMCLHIQYN